MFAFIVQDLLRRKLLGRVGADKQRKKLSIWYYTISSEIGYRL